MVDGIIATIFAYERETGSRLRAITIGKDEFTSLALEYEKRYKLKVSDPFYLDDVRIDWEE